MILIDNKYNIGDSLYIKTDKDQKLRILTQITILPIGLRYCLSCDEVDTWHYDIEITNEKNILINSNE